MVLWHYINLVLLLLFIIIKMQGEKTPDWITWDLKNMDRVKNISLVGSGAKFQCSQQLIFDVKEMRHFVCT